MTKYLRSPTLVLYWQDGELVFENYALRTRMSADPVVCSILHFCDKWQSLRKITTFLNNYSEASIRETLEQMWANGVLERSDHKRDPRVLAMESWTDWNPAAGFFHFSTKDTPFTSDPSGALREFQRRTTHDPMPMPVKEYPNAKRIRLPITGSTGEFAEVLNARRTWRKYGPEPVSLAAFSQIMQLTFGIQGWVDVPGLGRAAMKTSPSGGDLHPIEAYVLAQRVKGLKRGLYHYNGARHELEWIRAGVSRKTLERNLGSQWWFARGAFLVLMTAVFGRTRWKYKFPRVYRSILLEAGHLCQTFCLTATWLKLAPFCTIAQADTKWEQWLGIDGVDESIIYVAGAGTKPKDMREAHLGMLGKRIGTNF
jgi:SagB-type dehydrogenase family enzyme